MHSKESKSLRILKSKLRDWFEFEKDGKIPTYAVYAILNVIKTEPELSEDSYYSKNIREYLIQQNIEKMREDSLQAAKNSSIADWNRTNSLYKYENDTKNNAEFKFVEK